jgi:N-acetylneuraminic acid mutarotase
MQTARKYHSAALLPSGKVLVVGGSNDLDGYPTSVELYDPEVNSWIPAGTLTIGRDWPTATLLPSGKVLVVGGFNREQPRPTEVELYDPVANNWMPAAPLGTARSGHTATLLPNGKVLVVGGYGMSEAMSVELYDPETDSWVYAAPIGTVRGNHTATLLPSGKVLVVGGDQGRSSDGLYDRSVASAELYDPVADRWTPAATLTDRRFSHTATLLPSGKVVVLGGNSGGIDPEPLDSTELYDPEANRWTPVGSLRQARERHTATLLPNGKVLVLGGSGPGQLSWVELYDPVIDQAI